MESNSNRIIVAETAAECAAALKQSGLIDVQSAAVQEVVYVCIGTDRATGDCFGLLVGRKLQKAGLEGVYGNLDEPIHAKNIESHLQLIRSKHENPFIVAIDACLGGTERVGKMLIKRGPIAPGLALGASIEPVGDISISGVVNVRNSYAEVNPWEVLASTRLSLVMKMAEAAAAGILEVCNV